MSVTHNMVPEFYSQGKFNEAVITYPLEDRFITIGIRPVSDDNGCKLITQLILEDSEGRIGESALIIALGTNLDRNSLSNAKLLITKEANALIEQN